MRVVNYSNTFMIRCIDPVVVPELVAGQHICAVIGVLTS